MFYFCCVGFLSAMENIKQNYRMVTVLCAAQQELSQKFVLLLMLPPKATWYLSLFCHPKCCQLSWSNIHNCCAVLKKSPLWNNAAEALFQNLVKLAQIRLIRKALNEITPQIFCHFSNFCLIQGQRSILKSLARTGFFGPARWGLLFVEPPFDAFMRCSFFLLHN